MPQIETTFVDITSIVPASWFNRLQKHLAGFLNLKVSVSGTSVQVSASSSDGVASCYIGGEMRRNDTTASVAISGGADTYNVYAVATAAVDTFALEFSATVPATSPYRKIAEVDWNGSAITALRGVRGRVVDHDHDGYDTPKISHNDLDNLTTGDPHTQYSIPAGTRAFTGTVAGATPTASTHLATKAYADSVLRTVPVGGVFWWPTADAAPTGFLLADGSAVSRTTYSQLFAKIGTTYGVGDGSTTFNLPDLRGRFIAGKGGALNLGDTGGALSHAHTQAGHTHTLDSHSHTTPTHTHTGATTGSGGSHTHTQGVTGSSTTHTHTGPSHAHSATGLSVAATGGASVGSRHAGDGDSGLFAEDDLDASSSSTYHTHTDGSYITCAPTQSLSGNTGGASKSHLHPIDGNSYAHTHNAGSVSGSTGSAGTGTTGSAGTHSHTNPTTASGGSHTHASGGNTGTAAPTTAAGGTVASASGGADNTGATVAAPYLTLNAIIRYQ